MAGSIFSYCCFSLGVVLICVVTKIEAVSATNTTITVEPKFDPVWFVEGDPLTLTCTVESTKDYTPEWWNGGERVSDESTSLKTSEEVTGSYKKTLTLTKSDASADDVGLYYCSYDGKDQMKQVEMVTVTTRDANLTQGYHTTLTCDVEPCNSICSITWLKGDTPLSKIAELDGRVTYGQYNTSVTISNSQFSDVGLYTCIIQFNRDSKLEQTFKRNVGMRGKPYVEASEAQALKTVTNTSISLVCPVSTYPEPEVFWKRGDDIIEASDRYVLMPYNGVPDAKLDIKNPTEKDYGQYVCLTENSMGKSEFSIELNVNDGDGNTGNSFTTGIVSIVVGLFVSTVRPVLL